MVIGIIFIDTVHHQLQIAQNHKEHIVEIMGDPAGQAAHGFHFLHMDNFFLQCFVFCLNTLVFSYVLNRADGFDRVSVCIIFGFAPFFYIFDAPVFHAQPMINDVGFFVFQGPDVGLMDFFPVFGMGSMKKGFIGCGKGGWIDFKESVDFLGPK